MKWCIKKRYQIPACHTEAVPAESVSAILSLGQSPLQFLLAMSHHSHVWVTVFHLSGFSVLHPVIKRTLLPWLKTPRRTEIFLMPSFLWSDRSKYTVWCSPLAILVVFKLLANTAKLVPAVSWGPQPPGMMVRFVGTATTWNTKADLGTYRDWVCRHPGYMYLYSPLWLSR